MDKSAVRIVMLDDDPFMLRLIASMLRRMGYGNLTTFERARLALDLLDSGTDPPALILLDLNMPEMDGIEFVRHLVQRQFRGHLVLISGEDDRMLQAAESLVRAHHMKVLGKLHKPVAPGTLENLLAELPEMQLEDKFARTASFTGRELRHALANRQLLNHYQPQINLASGQLVGVEALVRWGHPDLGMIYPDQFVSLAEECGAIDDLTDAVVVAALGQQRAWQSLGLSVRMAINLSMNNLINLEFADRLVGMVAAAGVSPRDLTLEVTESKWSRDLRTPLEVLSRLRLRRFSLSIDDFGTGHSSLSQLRDFPFDELKIDRGFVRGAARDDTGRAICRASLELAQQLRMSSVAEGIEDRSDWDFLRAADCTIGQGYFMARPMPGDAVARWAVAWAKRLQDESLVTSVES